MENMRIGFFTDTYLPALRGIEISIETFRKCFENLGHEVFIYAQKVPGYKDKNPNVYRFSSVLVNRAPQMRLVFPYFPRKTYQHALANELDIAHIHSPFSVGLLGKHIAKKQNIPIVYTQHTRYPVHAKIYFHEHIVLPYLAKKISVWFANISNTTIAPSLKIKKILREYGVDKKVPIEVVLTGVDLQKFYPDAAQKNIIRKKLNIGSGKKIALFVGSVNRVKNVDFIFDVFKKLLLKRKDIVLALAGDGDLRKELAAEAKKLKLTKNIKFLGVVPYKEIASHYQAADLFLFPSLTDTQGIVLLEAMACGVPVLTLKDDAFAGVVKDSHNGFIVPKQSIALFKNKIEQLIDHPDLYQTMSANAKATAAKFSREKEAEKMLAIYNNLLESHKP